MLRALVAASQSYIMSLSASTGSHPQTVSSVRFGLFGHSSWQLGVSSLSESISGVPQPQMPGASLSSSSGHRSGTHAPEHHSTPHLRTRFASIGLSIPDGCRRVEVETGHAALSRPRWCGVGACFALAGLRVQDWTGDVGLYAGHTVISIPSGLAIWACVALSVFVVWFVIGACLASTIGPNRRVHGTHFAGRTVPARRFIWACFASVFGSIPNGFRAVDIRAGLALITVERGCLDRTAFALTIHRQGRFRRAGATLTGISIPNQTVRACFAGTGLFIPDRESRIGRFTGHTAVVVPDGFGVGAGLTRPF